MIKSALISVYIICGSITDSLDYYIIDLLWRLVRPYLKRISEP